MASVKVAVRVRPFNQREVDLGSQKVVSVSGSQVILEPPGSSGGQSQPNTSTPIGGRSGEKGRQHKFTFDFSYWSHNREDEHFVDQDQVFKDLGTDVVENAFEGYNACVFAYGQTGSGKTFTMMGTEENRGLIPRICQTMFEKMKSGKNEGTTYRTEVSYLEIYNERVKDLLRKSSEHNLRVREHPQLGPYVENLSKHLVMDYGEILTLMEKGNEIRTTASTNMNDTSSRSHAIFTITFVNAGFLQGVPHETVSKIHLVDLAGSERADATGATGQRLKEGAHINKSLVTLGSVISALAEASNNSSMTSSTHRELKGGSQKSVFIPYRDSVLTWLLKDSLGGNSKTIMIATISPADVNHGETLSTLRYANRAKNIINKPTVNEDPNVRLIRDLRAEIERLKSMMSLDPVTLSTVQKQLAVKEAQERHLTEEWTEKWKEAANILKEQNALALKRTGLGVILDSDKPHLVGIDEDVLSTGITLYHLKDGETLIGTDGNGNDINLKGPSVEDLHCKITLDDGVATLVPMPGALCMVNAALVTEPTKLSQGCVVVLGKTNMFRYNDPKEAANLRQNKETGQLPQNRSLLSHSLSDLRQSSFNGSRVWMLKDENDKLHSSDGNIQEIDDMSTSATTTPVTNEDSASERLFSSTTTESNLDMDIFKDTENNNGGSLAGDKRDQQERRHSDEMNELYKCINEQKNIIMSCLESENCDIATLNKQISVLQNMQENFTKLEYDITKNMWIGSKLKGSVPEESLKSFDEQFSILVEQEVDKRIFQEKLLRSEAEYHEREMIRIQKERELNEIRRQHEKEIYLLKRKLHEVAASQQSNLSENPVVSDVFQINIQIPSFSTVGSHVEYEVAITAKDCSWVVIRRFRQFRDLHLIMSQVYGQLVSSLSFPARRIFGNTSHEVSMDRQIHLQNYLNQLVRRLSNVPESPIYRNPTRSGLLGLSDFFCDN